MKTEKTFNSSLFFKSKKYDYCISGNEDVVTEEAIKYLIEEHGFIESPILWNKVNSCLSD